MRALEPNLSANHRTPSRKTEMSGPADWRHDVDPILHLQRTAGNQAIQRRLEINTNSEAAPRIGAVDDPLEREADRRADAVMRDQTGQPEKSPAASSPNPARHKLPQSIAAQNAQRALADGGRPMSNDERSLFESRFSTDFSSVRLHDGPSANAAARGLGARAFTLGTHVGFASPTFTLRTLAHELAHVVQPHSGDPVIRRDSDDDDEIEMPEEYVGRSSMCGGQRCITDEEIYADLNKSRAEDAAAEARATAERKRRLDIKRHGTKQQKWEVEFEEDPRLTKNIGAVSGTRDDGIMTNTGVRVPAHAGDYLSPRPFYETRDAAMLVYQGFIHYAELVEAGHGPAALDLAIKTTGGAPIPDNLLDLRGYTHWSEKARDAREKAMLLAMIAETGAAGEGAAADLAMQRAEDTFAQQLEGMIGQEATVRGAAMTVEGVGVSGIRVSVQNGELVASYDTIVNVSGVAGQGKRIQAAFEAGAVQAARNAGLQSARVAVESIINQQWKEYLLSIGYQSESMELRPGVFSWVLSKVFSL